MAHGTYPFLFISENDKYQLLDTRFGIINAQGEGKTHTETQEEKAADKP